MKKLFAVLLLTTLAVPALAADATPMDKAALAKAVAAVMPLDQQIAEFTNQVAGGLPAEKQALFKSIMKKNIDIPKLRIAATGALEKTYTEGELRAMHEFYSKPEAKEIMRKLGDFGDILQPTVQEMVAKAVEESQKAGVLTP